MAAAAVGLPQPAMQGQHIPDGGPAELPRPYKCPLCDKAFHRLEHQTRHIRTHTGEKPHACNFPGCSKRFSRSDELTRHSRIHANPHSRRGRMHHTATNNTAAAVAAAVHGTGPEVHSMANVMGPPPMAWSNSSSNVPSPNVSPPQSYHAYGSNASPSFSSYSGSTRQSPETLSHQPQGGPANMNLLATAASQAAREHELSSVPLPNRGNPLHVYSSPSHSHSSAYYKPASSSSVPRLPSLAAYHYSQPLSRSHSTEGEEQYMQRLAKRSRPGSPFSTAPPSPSFSGGSHSPPTGMTPAITPGPSPHLPAHDVPHDMHLPGIRHLSLQHMQSPLLEPLEPTTEANGGMPPNHAQKPYSRSQNNSNSGFRISDIVNREDGAQRKLPNPTAPGVSATELQSFSRSPDFNGMASAATPESMDRT